MKILIVIIAVAVVAQAEIFDRVCRTPEQLGVKTNFLPNSYLGIWYEIERYEKPFQADSDCVTAEYTLLTNVSINVFNRGFIIANETIISDNGVGLISFPDESPLRAMLNVTFAEGQPNISNYWILATDYFSYAFVVSCFNLPENRSSESYWLLSRSPVISDASRVSADRLIDQHLDRSRIRSTNQNNIDCRRLPATR